MYQTITSILKWILIPAFLAGSVFSGYSGNFQFLMDFGMLLGALFFALKAMGTKEYLWAIGFGAVVVICGPILLAFKVFLLMGLACGATFVGLVACFRMRLETAEVRL